MENEMMLLGQLGGVKEVERRLEEVFANNAKISFHGQRLASVRPGEKLIGTVDNDILRALYVVIVETGSETKVSAAQATVATSEVEAKELKHKARTLDHLNDIANDLFWSQLKLELVGDENESDTTIGLRVDWQVVEFQRQGASQLGAALLGPFLGGGPR